MRSSKTGGLEARAVRALQYLDMLSLKLGDALVVQSTLFDHVGQRAGPLVQVLADVVERLAHRQEHLAESLILRLTRDELLFHSPQPGDLLADFRQPTRQRLAIAQASALGLALPLQARIALLVQHHDDLVLELLEGLLELRELGQLRLGRCEAPLKLLDAAGLLLVFDRHALQALTELGELFAVAAVFFVQPAYHLAQLR